MQLSGGDFLVEFERAMAQGMFTEMHYIPGGYAKHSLTNVRFEGSYVSFPKPKSLDDSLPIPKLEIRDLVLEFLPVRRIDPNFIDGLVQKEERGSFMPHRPFETLEEIALSTILERRRRNEDIFRIPISIKLLCVLPGFKETWGYRRLCMLPDILCKKVDSSYQYIIPSILGGAQLLSLYINSALFELSCRIEGRGPYEEFFEYLEKVESSPRELNKKYRANLSYYVKAFGIGAKYIRVQTYAEDPHELNAKEATPQRIERRENPFAQEVMSSDIPKILREHLENYGTRILKVEHLQEELTDEWIIRLSQILAFQGLVGYGRSLATAKDDRELSQSEFQRLRDLNEEDRSLVSRFSTIYASYWDTLLSDANAAGMLTPTKEMLPFVIKEFAKSTSAGMTVKIQLPRRDKPRNERADRRIMRKKSGVYLFHQNPMDMSLDGVRFKLGSRDVPVKNTRLVYSIPFPIICKQASLIGLLNRFVTRPGTGTSPLQPFNVSKIIVGDLEATGCRVLDHGDVLRNSSKDQKTLCLDYSDYDTSLGPVLFRGGFFSALKRAGFDDKAIEEAFGLTRVIGSNWKRRDDYKELGGKIFERVDSVFKVTHLSGELTTLIANSVFNAAAGAVIRENVPGCLSEQYIGDDSMLIFHRQTPIQKLLTTPKKVAAALGLEVSIPKTTAFPYSIEKTQTHAKFGWYIPQDRIQILETEKDFKRVGSHSEWLAYYSKMVTKATRGFSMALGSALTYLYYLEGCITLGFTMHRPLLIPHYRGGFGFRRGYMDIGSPILKGSADHIKISYETWANVSLEPIQERKFILPRSPILEKIFSKTQLEDCGREVQTLLMQALYAENALKPRFKVKDFIAAQKPYRGVGSSANLYGPTALYSGPFIAFSRDLHPPLHALGKVDHRLAVHTRDDIDRIIGKDPKARILLHHGNIFKVRNPASYFFYPELMQEILLKSRGKSLDIKNLGIYNNEFTSMLDFGLEQNQTFAEREITRAHRLRDWPSRLRHVKSCDL